MTGTENIYYKIYGWENLALAFKKARRGKTKKGYVLEFEKNLVENLQQLQFELMTLTYKPRLLKTFILRDPKTRKISKSDFRDRIVHHALVQVIEPIFDKSFIYDSCANRIGKGNLFALKRFEIFKRKITKNLKIEAFCFKADIKHYFFEVNHQILLSILKRKIKDEKTMELVLRILNNLPEGQIKGMPLGNLTSQFFANVYLNELDFFVKQNLKAKFYIRYVDDFVILHNSREQLEKWRIMIDYFLKETLKIEIHRQKSRIFSLSRGVDFVGFRNFYFHRLLRKRNIIKMKLKIKNYCGERISEEKISANFQGWNAYAKWANCFNLRKLLESYILKTLYDS